MRIFIYTSLNLILYLGVIYSLSLQRFGFTKMMITLLIAGLVISAALTPWYKGGFRESFKKSFKIGMAVSAILFLIGYWYPLVKTHILYS